MFARACVFGLVLSSCLVPDGPFASRDGTATIGWTIGGSWHPSACAAENAAWVRIVLRIERDMILSDERVACTAMAKRYVLDRGWYDAMLTLLDADDAPVSSTLYTGSFYVSPGSDQLVGVDFDGARENVVVSTPELTHE